MKLTLRTHLLRIFLTVLTIGIFASCLTSFVINPDIDPAATTIIVIFLVLISFLNIVAILELRDPASVDKATKVGLWVNLGIFNITEMFLVFKFGFQLF